MPRLVNRFGRNQVRVFWSHPVTVEWYGISWAKDATPAVQTAVDQVAGYTGLKLHIDKENSAPSSK